ALPVQHLHVAGRARDPRRAENGGADAQSRRSGQELAAVAPAGLFRGPRPELGNLSHFHSPCESLSLQTSLSAEFVCTQMISVAPLPAKAPRLTRSPPGPATLDIVSSGLRHAAHHESGSPG